MLSGMFQNQILDETPKKIMFSLVIPFFNEEKNVGFVLEELLEELSGKDFTYEIIAVNNGSTDRTSSVLRKYSNHNFIKVVILKENRGFGWGIRQGMKVASGEWIGFLGGDGQTDPKDLIKMMNISQSHRDICMYTGYRIMRNDGKLRAIISKIFNCLFLILFQVRLKDVNGTPKLIHGKIIRSLPLETKGWFLDAELILRLKAKKMSIVECPVIFRKRNSGKTHINLYTILEFIRKMLFYFFNRRNLIR